MISNQKHTVLSIMLSLALTACASAKRLAESSIPNQSKYEKPAQGASEQDTSSLDLDDFNQEIAFSEDVLIDDESSDDTASSEDGEESFEVEQGFCRDDVYSHHLIRKYRAEKLADNHARLATKNKKRKTKKARVKPEGDFVALSYARDRMNGPIAPYFGAIPVVVNNRVDYWVQYFKTSGRKEFMKWLIRGEALKDKVQPILQDGGVPMEFYYLAMVESGFNTGAKSRARATGTWQFMRGTAQLYGLQVNHWVDERLDPLKSTIAAANYLRDLYAELGDWYLAMAAYNAGPGKIRSAMRRAGSRDFWKIAETNHIPRETANYVPKVLAAILLASDTKSHGFDIQDIAVESPPNVEVLVKKPVQLDEIARKLQVTRRQVAAWNPELIRNITPPSRKGYNLRLPPHLAEKWEIIHPQLAAVEVTDVQTHTIRKGETLSFLARRYRVSVRDIKAVNPDLSAERLRPGKTLAIPIPGINTKGV